MARQPRAGPELCNVLAADLVTLYRGILVFLQRPAPAIQCGCDSLVCLVRPLSKRFVPREINQGRNNHDFNQQSLHRFRDCQIRSVRSMEIGGYNCS